MFGNDYYKYFQGEPSYSYETKTTSTVGISEELIWIEAATNAVINADAESAMMRADKIVEGYKKRYSKD